MDKEIQVYKHIIDNKVFPYLFGETNISDDSSNLVKALCILNFDDEIGQVTENIWPEDSLDKINMKNISGLGFPETNSISDDGELQYIFKIRQNDNVPLKCTSISDQKFYYCYTVFIQKKMSTCKRGYMQKSIMIVSQFYYKKLFVGLLEHFKISFLEDVLVNKRLFTSEKLEKMYESFNSINNVKNYYFEDLHIKQEEKEEVINYTRSDILEDIKTFKANLQISIYPQNNNFFEHLSLYYVSKIWNLWELVITETPLIVQSDTSSSCSEIVFLLSSLIFPLNYCGDVRPYFTIYDSDFKEYKDNPELKASHTPILGVINPICVKTLNDWPVLHFDDLYFGNSNLSNPTKSISLIEEKVLLSQLSLPNFKRKFVLSPNKTLVRTFVDFIDDNTNKSLDKINIYLRMCLIELNNDFMRTFEEYFFSHEIKLIQRLVAIKPNFSIFEIFNEDKFFKYLNGMGNNMYFNKKYVMDKTKTLDLYSNFVKTKCFNLYLKNLLTRFKKLDN